MRSGAWPDGFVEHFEEEFARIEHSLSTASSCARFLVGFVSHWVSPVANTLLQRNSELAHDLNKAAIALAQSRAGDELADDAERLLELLQLSEVALMRTDAAQAERSLILVGGALRQTLGHPFREVADAVIDIPKKVRIRMWQGAKESQFRPLLTTLRANVERALRAVAPERRYYRCTVRLDRDEVLVLVANTFDPRAPENPHSNGIGSASMRARALVLGGSVRRNQRTDEDCHGLPVWKVEIAFPGI